MGRSRHVCRRSRGPAKRLCALVIFIVSGVTPFLGGCQNAQTREAPTLPVVEVVKVVERDVPLYSEWTASTDGLVNATIRAQVQGYLVERHYQEGEFVKKGQILFRIDPRPFQAVLDQAKGQLSQAQARWENSKATLERIKPLVEQKAVSLKDLDDAVGNEQASHAAVTSAQAMVDKAEVDLGFTKIVSPVDGIAGIARAQIGDLVGPGSIEELTTVSTVNPIKVYIPMSEQEYLKYVQGRSLAQAMSLQLILADGNIHPHKGSLAFADRQVDVKTGTIKVAALFPNPGNVLRPGQFARVRAETAIKKGALLVPQRAVMELQGSYQVAVVEGGSKVAMRPVKVAERVDSLWVIEQGLRSGDQVVAEGLQKVREGLVVATKPFVSTASTAPEGQDQPISQKPQRPGSSLPAPSAASSNKM